MHEDCRDALVRLCERYRYPAHAYVRRRGYPEQDGQDLTQDFFVRILERTVPGPRRSQPRPIPFLPPELVQIVSRRSS